MIVSLLLMGVCIADEPEIVYRGTKSIDEGNHYLDAVNVDFGDEEYPSKVVDRFRGMINLKVLVVGGPRYTDRHLREIAKLPALRSLVLDSTDITDDAIAQLQRERPELAIYRSQRWAIEQIESLAFEPIIETQPADVPPELRELLGDRYFQEAVRVTFRSDDETGPRDKIQSEELAPLRMLRTATHVDLAYTRINDIGMQYLKGLTNVESLRLPMDEVSEVGLANIVGMTNLNDFSGELDDEKLVRFAPFDRLQYLFTGGPRITDEGLESLAGLRGLTHLQLRAANVEGAGLRHLCALPRLETLDLEEANVRDLTHVGELPALKSLKLGNTTIDDAAMAALAGCSHLEFLSIANTNVGDAGIAHVKALPELRCLWARETQVGDDGVACLKELPELQILDLSNTRVGNEGLKALRLFPKLESLSIYGVAIGEAELRTLETLDRLKELRLDFPEQRTDPDKANAMRERLQQALPNCKINS